LDFGMSHVSYLFCSGEFFDDGPAPTGFEQTAGPTGGVLHLTENFWREIKAALPIGIPEQQMNVWRFYIAVNGTQPSDARSEGVHELFDDGRKLRIGHVLALLQTDNEMAGFSALAAVVKLH
jgi:hypothetical protein